MDNKIEEWCSRCDLFRARTERGECRSCDEKRERGDVPHDERPEMEEWYDE